MPIFQYSCEACEAEFEEILNQSEDIKKYADWHPCPSCNGVAKRDKVSTFAFNFKGGTVGNSGVHDVDYPVLDKAIGRSSNERWIKINKDKEAKDKARKEFGTNAITRVDEGKFVPTNTNVLKAREKGISMAKGAIDESASSEITKHKKIS